MLAGADAIFEYQFAHPDLRQFSLVDAHTGAPLVSYWRDYYLARYFPPGTGYHYSNTNYQLAAMVLEKTSGRSLSELLQAIIVDPLALAHTTLLPPDTASPEFRGYLRRSTDGSVIDVTDDLLIFGNGGPGGIITTPEELLTVLQAIVSGQLLPDRQKARVPLPRCAAAGCIWQAARTSAASRS